MILIQHNARNFNPCNKARKGNKRQTYHKEIKWSLFEDDMII